MVAAARILIVFLAVCGFCPLTAISERIPLWLDTCNALFRLTFAVAHSYFFLLASTTVNTIKGNTFQVILNIQKRANFYINQKHISDFPNICSLADGGLPNCRFAIVTCVWSVLAKTDSPAITLSICACTMLPLHHDYFFIRLICEQHIYIVEPHNELSFSFYFTIWVRCSGYLANGYLKQL
jgi:hypothetical protein